MKTGGIYLLLYLVFTTVVKVKPFVTSVSESPVLMKILKSVDAATSDEHLFEVTLKLLKGICLCMHETLRAKEERINYINDNLVQTEDDTKTAKWKQFNLYKNIYNNTCFNLRQELARKINGNHNVTLDDDEEFWNGSNCGNKVEFTTETVKIMSTSPKPTNYEKGKTQLENIIFKALIGTKDYHNYNFKRYSLFGKAKAFVRPKGKHSVIVILTLYPDHNESQTWKLGSNISVSEINNTLYTRSNINIDIIDTRYDPEEKNSEEHTKPNFFSECMLYSTYKFLIESEKRNLTKVFKLLRRNETFKVYMEIETRKNHTDYSHICCNHNSLIAACKKDFIVETMDTEEDLAVKKIKYQNTKKERLVGYKDTIAKIKSLVKIYGKKLKKFNKQPKINKMKKDKTEKSECIGTDDSASSHMNDAESASIEKKKEKSIKNYFLAKLNITTPSSLLSSNTLNGISSKEQLLNTTPKETLLEQFGSISMTTNISNDIISIHTDSPIQADNKIPLINATHETNYTINTTLEETATEDAVKKSSFETVLQKNSNESLNTTTNSSNKATSNFLEKVVNSLNKNAETINIVNSNVISAEYNNIKESEERKIDATTKSNTFVESLISFSDNADVSYENNNDVTSQLTRVSSTTPDSELNSSLSKHKTINIFENLLSTKISLQEDANSNTSLEKYTDNVHNSSSSSRFNLQKNTIIYDVSTDPIRMHVTKNSDTIIEVSNLENVRIYTTTEKPHFERTTEKLPSTVYDEIPEILHFGERIYPKTFGIDVNYLSSMAIDPIRRSTIAYEDYYSTASTEATTMELPLAKGDNNKNMIKTLDVLNVKKHALLSPTTFDSQSTKFSNPQQMFEENFNDEKTNSAILTKNNISKSEKITLNFKNNNSHASTESEISLNISKIVLRKNTTSEIPNTHLESETLTSNAYTRGNNDTTFMDKNTIYTSIPTTLKNVTNFDTDTLKDRTSLTSLQPEYGSKETESFDEQTTNTEVTESSVVITDLSYKATSYILSDKEENLLKENSKSTTSNVLGDHNIKEKENQGTDATTESYSFTEILINFIGDTDVSYKNNVGFIPQLAKVSSTTPDLESNGILSKHDIFQALLPTQISSQEDTTSRIEKRRNNTHTFPNASNSNILKTKISHDMSIDSINIPQNVKKYTTREITHFDLITETLPYRMYDEIPKILNFGERIYPPTFGIDVNYLSSKAFIDHIRRSTMTYEDYSSNASSEATTIEIPLSTEDGNKNIPQTFDVQNVKNHVASLPNNFHLIQSSKSLDPHEISDKNLDDGKTNSEIFTTSNIIKSKNMTFNKSHSSTELIISPNISKTVLRENNTNQTLNKHLVSETWISNSNTREKNDNNFMNTNTIFFSIYNTSKNYTDAFTDTTSFTSLEAEYKNKTTLLAIESFDKQTTDTGVTDSSVVIPNNHIEMNFPILTSLTLQGNLTNDATVDLKLNEIYSIAYSNTTERNNESEDQLRIDQSDISNKKVTALIDSEYSLSHPNDVEVGTTDGAEVAIIDAEYNYTVSLSQNIKNEDSNDIATSAIARLHDSKETENFTQNENYDIQSQTSVTHNIFTNFVGTLTTEALKKELYKKESDKAEFIFIDKIINNSVEAQKYPNKEKSLTTVGKYEETTKLITNLTKDLQVGDTFEYDLKLDKITKKDTVDIVSQQQQQKIYDSTELKKVASNYLTTQFIIDTDVDYFLNFMAKETKNSTTDLLQTPQDQAKEKSDSLFSTKKSNYLTPVHSDNISNVSTQSAKMAKITIQDETYMINNKSQTQSELSITTGKYTNKDLTAQLENNFKIILRNISNTEQTFLDGFNTSKEYKQTSDVTITRNIETKEVFSHKEDTLPTNNPPNNTYNNDKQYLKVLDASTIHLIPESTEFTEYSTKVLTTTPYYENLIDKYTKKGYNDANMQVTNETNVFTSMSNERENKLMGIIYTTAKSVNSTHFITEKEPSVTVKGELNLKSDINLLHSISSTEKLQAVPLNEIKFQEILDSNDSVIFTNVTKTPSSEQWQKVTISENNNDLIQISTKLYAFENAESTLSKTEINNSIEHEIETQSAGQDNPNTLQGESYKYEVIVGKNENWKWDKDIYSDLINTMDPNIQSNGEIFNSAVLSNKAFTNNYNITDYFKFTTSENIYNTTVSYDSNEKEALLSDWLINSTFKNKAENDLVIYHPNTNVAENSKYETVSFKNESRKCDKGLQFNNMRDENFGPEEFFFSNTRTNITTDLKDYTSTEKETFTYEVTTDDNELSNWGTTTDILSDGTKQINLEHTSSKNINNKTQLYEYDNTERNIHDLSPILNNMIHNKTYEKPIISNDTNILPTETIKYEVTTNVNTVWELSSSSLYETQEKDTLMLQSQESDESDCKSVTHNASNSLGASAPSKLSNLDVTGKYKIITSNKNVDFETISKQETNEEFSGKPTNFTLEIIRKPNGLGKQNVDDKTASTTYFHIPISEPSENEKESVLWTTNINLTLAQSNVGSNKQNINGAMKEKTKNPNDYTNTENFTKRNESNDNATKIYEFGRTEGKIVTSYLIKYITKNDSEIHEDINALVSEIITEGFQNLKQKKGWDYQSKNPQKLYLKSNQISTNDFILDKHMDTGKSEDISSESTNTGFNHVKSVPSIIYSTSTTPMESKIYYVPFKSNARINKLIAPETLYHQSPAKSDIASENIDKTSKTSSVITQFKQKTHDDKTLDTSVTKQSSLVNLTSDTNATKHDLTNISNLFTFTSLNENSEPDIVEDFVVYYSTDKTTINTADNTQPLSQSDINGSAIDLPYVTISSDTYVITDENVTDVHFTEAPNTKYTLNEKQKLINLSEITQNSEQTNEEFNTEDKITSFIGTNPENTKNVLDINEMTTQINLSSAVSRETTSDSQFNAVETLASIVEYEPEIFTQIPTEEDNPSLPPTTKDMTKIIVYTSTEEDTVSDDEKNNIVNIRCSSASNNETATENTGNSQQMNIEPVTNFPKVYEFISNTSNGDYKLQNNVNVIYDDTTFGQANTYNIINDTSTKKSHSIVYNTYEPTNEEDLDLYISTLFPEPFNVIFTPNPNNEQLKLNGTLESFTATKLYDTSTSSNSRVDEMYDSVMTIFKENQPTNNEGPNQSIPYWVEEGWETTSKLVPISEINEEMLVAHTLPTQSSISHVSVSNSQNTRTPYASASTKTTPVMTISSNSTTISPSQLMAPTPVVPTKTRYSIIVPGTIPRIKTPTTSRTVIYGSTRKMPKPSSKVTPKNISQETTSSTIVTTRITTPRAITTKTSNSSRYLNMSAKLNISSCSEIQEVVFKNLDELNTMLRGANCSEEVVVVHNSMYQQKLINENNKLAVAQLKLHSQQTKDLMNKPTRVYKYKDHTPPFEFKHFTSGHVKIHEKIYATTSKPKLLIKSIAVQNNLLNKLKTSKWKTDHTKESSSTRKLIRGPIVNLRTVTNKILKPAVKVNTRKKIVSQKKTNLYPIHVMPQNTQKKIMNRIQLGNQHKEFMTMNTKDFFSSRRFVTQKNIIMKEAPKVRKVFPRPRTVLKLRPPMTRELILRPKFENIERPIQTRKYFLSKPLFPQDIYRQDFNPPSYLKTRTDEPEQPQEIKKLEPETFEQLFQVNAKVDSAPEDLKLKSPVEEPYYIPSVIDPSLKEDDDELEQETMQPLKLEKYFMSMGESESHEPGRPRRPFYRRRFEATTPRPITRHSPRTIFFLSPTVAPYNKYYY